MRLAIGAGAGSATFTGLFNLICMENTKVALMGSIDVAYILLYICKHAHAQTDTLYPSCRFRTEMRTECDGACQAPPL